ncbi:NnrU family protein [Pelagibius sp. CAU 1746]|uniref:NnrU family protein n=1 Tax=Pelagibius sp. CAU 1746 TaxID=3140370 RepID=UPI00325AE507
MIEFFAAIAVFLAAHVLPAATGLRVLLIEKLGRPAYLAVYSLVSLATIAWVIAAALAAPYIELWAPSRATALVPLAAMLPASILLAGALWQPSPLSVSFRGGLADPRRAGLAAQFRHPVLWAFFLWAAAHLVANGDLVSLILFGSLAGFSLAGMKRMERRARARLSEADYAAAAAQTDGGPAARLRRVVPLCGVIDLLAGLLLYAALLHLHGPVIGLDPLAWL